MLPADAISEIQSYARGACLAAGVFVAPDATAAACFAAFLASDTSAGGAEDSPRRWRCFTALHAARAEAGGDEHGTAWQHYAHTRYCAGHAGLALAPEVQP